MIIFLKKFKEISKEGNQGEIFSGGKLTGYLNSVTLDPFPLRNTFYDITFTKVHIDR